jgi:hypothetical protein
VDSVQQDEGRRAADQAQEVFHLGQGFDFEEVAAARDQNKIGDT